MKALPELMRRWSAAFRDYRSLQRSPGPSSESARAARERELASARASLQGLKREIAEAQRVQELYRPQVQTHGYVWLFLRRPVR